jgi:hypothetical protein
MDPKSTQKSSSGGGFGTDNPKDGMSIVTPGSAPKLGGIEHVPDKSTPESTKGGK